MYRQIEPKFWHDPFVRTLDPDTKLIYLWLITNPRAHFSGIYSSPFMMAECKAETGISDKGLARGFEKLTKGLRMGFDDCAGVVYVAKMLKYQAKPSPNVSKGLASHLATLHNSFLINDFLEEYENWGIDFLGTPNNYPKGLARGFTQEQEQEQEKEQKYTCASDKPDSREDVLFDQFWDAYPKRKAKGQAKKAWAKIKRPAETLEKILAALEWQTESDDWKKENGQFIPYPATYLNAESWDDDPTDDILTADDMRPVSRSM